MTPAQIKSLRQRIGVSQEKFAQLLETTVVSINRWENGVNKPSRLYVKELEALEKKYANVNN